VAQKPEEFFDIRGRQEYLTAREQEILARANQRAPAGEVFGVFVKLLLVQLATILGLVIVGALLSRLEDGDAGWQSGFIGPMLLLVVPLAGTVWTLMALGRHDFSATPGPGTMRICVVAMVVVFIAFIMVGVWVLSLLDPITYNSALVSQLLWSALAVPTAIIGMALLILLTWRLALWLNLTLALVLLGMIVFVGLLPIFQFSGDAWPDPLLLGLRFIGPILLIAGIASMRTERALLTAENDPVDEFIDRAAGDFDPSDPPNQ
jgi:MFS family permease